MRASITGGAYQPGEIVGEYRDKYGDAHQAHRPKGRILRVLKCYDTPALRMNRVACELIGMKVKERRLAAGLSQTELSRRAGLKNQTPKQYIYALENAMRDNGMRMGTLYAIALSLDCEPSDLLPKLDEVKALARIVERQAALVE